MNRMGGSQTLCFLYVYAKTVDSNNNQVVIICNCQICYNHIKGGFFLKNGNLLKNQEFHFARAP